MRQNNKLSLLLCEKSVRVKLLLELLLTLSVYTFFIPEVVLCKREEEKGKNVCTLEDVGAIKTKKETYSHLLKSITINKIVEPFTILLDNFLHFFMHYCRSYFLHLILWHNKKLVYSFPSLVRVGGKFLCLRHSFSFVENYS